MVFQLLGLFSGTNIEDSLFPINKKNLYQPQGLPLMLHSCSDFRMLGAPPGLLAGT